MTQRALGELTRGADYRNATLERPAPVGSTRQPGITVDIVIPHGDISRP